MGILATAFILCFMGLAASEPTSQLTENKQQIICSQEQIKSFTNRFDSTKCITNVNQLKTRATELSSSSVGTGQPNQELTEEANNLLHTVCADTCLAVVDLLQKCTPDEDLFGDDNVTIQYCYCACQIQDPGKCLANQDAEGGTSTMNIALAIGGTALVGTAFAVAAPLVILPALGFGSGGIVAGSAAAAWQATVGNVVAGSTFAALQSAGVAGVSAATTAGLGAAGAVGGAAAGGVAMAASEKLAEDKP